MIHPRLIAFALGLALVSAGGSAPPDATKLVELEHRFAQDAQQFGTRDAFLLWLAPTAVVFEPGPVNGHKVWLARPRLKSRLAWEPSVAVMSSGGDLGWTSGPWDWREDSTKAQAAAWGEYVTVWKRAADGDWRAVLDMGIDHARPDGAGTGCTAMVLPAPGHIGKGPLARRQSLWQSDVAFAKAAGDSGVAGALGAFAAEDVHRLRTGHMRVVGADAAREAAAAVNEHGSFMSLAQYISESGDLGYTYGTFVQANAAGADSSYYLHIWKRGAKRAWELALDLLLPVPKAGS